MKCSKCRKLLIEYADGRLQNTLSKELKTHLENCHRCNVELKALRTSLNLVMETADEVISTPSEEFIPKLRGRIEHLNSSKTMTYFFACARSHPENRGRYSQKNISMDLWKYRWLRIAFAAALLLFILGTVFALRFLNNPEAQFTATQIRAIAKMPEGQMLMEMLPASRPYIDALVAAQQAEERHARIMSTLGNINPQLWERIFQVLETSVAAIQTADGAEANPPRRSPDQNHPSDVNKEEESSWDEEVI